LPQPALQESIAHVPVAQVAVALVRLQPVPQVPQFVSVFSEASQPLAGLLSQLPKPALQEIAQLPPEQLAVPFTVLHALPQPPQCRTLLVTFVSQPFAALPSQSPVPGLQPVQPQLPPTQLAVPLGQLQGVLQALQWLTLVWVLVSQPSFELELQSRKPALHTGTQAPPLQLVVPFALVQAVPQEPQWLALFAKFTSQPFDTCPSQLPNPVLQVIEHVPPEHAATPPAALQAWVQPPQWLGLLDVSTSQPFAS
jgi:hypothetical protein